MDKDIVDATELVHNWEFGKYQVLEMILVYLYPF